MTNIRTSWLRRGILAGAACVACLMTACVVVPADQYYRGGYGAYGEVINTAPPGDPGEVVTVSPGPGYFWIGGYWNWVGNRHVWVGGRWEAHRSGYAWAPHRWYREGPGWRAAPGHWQRR